jgi:predicted dehydrogenase
MRRDDARAPWTPPVDVVLVGCGAVAHTYYAPALTRLLASDWVGAVRLFDLNQGRAAEVAALFPAGSVALHWEDVLDDSAELAIVASPPVAHAEQVRALLEHGKHVLCEKPLAPNRAEGESFVDFARERGLLCAAGMVRRFSRSACLLRQLLSEERPTRVAWHEGSRFRWPVDSPTYFAPESGNQLLWDIGSHVVDLLIWWLGVPHEVAYCDDAMGGTATNCLLELEWPTGCSADVRLSREYELPSGLVVEQPSRILACRDVAESDVLLATGEAAAPDFEQRIPGSTALAGRTFLDSFELQLQNVLAAVRGVAPLWAPAGEVLDGVGALATMEADSGFLESPWLSRRELDTARTLRAGVSKVAAC